MKKLYFFTLLMISAATSYAQVPSYVPINGLVGWWPFNGNANDESGNGNNGAVNGATLTTDRFGQSNKSYNFNGSTYIDCGTSNSMAVTNGLTLSCWGKTSTQWCTGSNDCPVPLVGRWTNISNPPPFGTPEYSLVVNNSTITSAIVITTPPSAYVSAPVNYYENNWHFYTMTYDGNTNKIYVDGVLAASLNVTGSIQNYANKFVIGAYGIVTQPITGGWVGQLDDIALWNRALTPQEITTLYQSCNLNVTANPSTANAAIGANTSLVASGGNTYQWQTNPANNGWQSVNNNSTYSGAGTATLNISNVQLQNHQQQFRVISASGNCADTAYALINVTDTCINTITNSISVTDTLVINAVLSGVNPPNNSNTLLVYPNPARTHITIDNGNFALMNGYTVRINNALGQTVFTQAVNQQQFFIDLSTWTGNGLYYLDLIDNSGNSVETKVIVVQ